MAESPSWKCSALLVCGTTQPAHHVVGEPLQFQNQVLQLMLLAAEGLPGGWAGLNWVLEPEFSCSMFWG